MVSVDNYYVYLVTNEKEVSILKRCQQFHFTSPEIGLKMKTGLTVDFRNRESLHNEMEEGAVPLFYSQHIKQGKILEDIACYLFETVSGIQIAERNAMNIYDIEEIDVAIWNNQYEEGLKFLSCFILIECKNWSCPVSSIEVNWFANKVENRGLDFGILIATNGITKEKYEIKRAQSILLKYLRKYIRIIVIEKKDISALNNSNDMVDLIKKKICELVVKE